MERLQPGVLLCRFLLRLVIAALEIAEVEEQNPLLFQNDLPTFASGLFKINSYLNKNVRPTQPCCSLPSP